MDRSRQVRAGFQLSQHQTITGRTPRQGIFPRAEPAPGHGSALHGGQVPYSVKGCYLEVALSGEFRSDTGVDFWDIRLLVLRFPLLLRFLPAWVVPPRHADPQGLGLCVRTRVRSCRRFSSGNTLPAGAGLLMAFACGFAVVADCWSRCFSPPGCRPRVHRNGHHQRLAWGGSSASGMAAGGAAGRAAGRAAVMVLNCPISSW